MLGRRLLITSCGSPSKTRAKSLKTRMIGFFNDGKIRLEERYTTS
jgi:hypothetical protein